MKIRLYIKFIILVLILKCQYSRLYSQSTAELLLEIKDESTEYQFTYFTKPNTTNICERPSVSYHQLTELPIGSTTDVHFSCAFLKFFNDSQFVYISNYKADIESNSFQAKCDCRCKVNLSFNPELSLDNKYTIFGKYSFYNDTLVLSEDEPYKQRRLSYDIIKQNQKKSFLKLYLTFNLHNLVLIKIEKIRKEIIKKSYSLQDIFGFNPIFVKSTLNQLFYDK